LTGVIGLRQLPNALTLSRMLLTPVFATLLVRAGDGSDWAAGIVFGIAALTDQADGWAARRWRAASRIGTVLDPLADKLLIGVAVLLLIAAGRLPWWVVVPLISRQLVLWGMRATAPGRAFPVSALARLSAWTLAAAEVWPYAAALRSRPDPAGDALVIGGPGDRIGYADTGPRDGVPVIMCHGWGECRLTHPDPAVLDRVGVRLVTIDRPGVGRSDPQPGRALLDWPPLVARVADELGLNRFAVLGRSAGAAYAAVTAFGLPDRVSAVCLVSGIGPPSPGAWRLLAKSDFRKLIFWLRLLPPLARPTLWLGVRLVRPHVRRLLDRHVAGLPDADRAVLAHPGTHEMRVRSLREAFRQGEEGIYEDAVVFTRAWGFDPSAIMQPTGIWHGEADTIVNAGFGRQLAALIGCSRAAFVPGAGHYLLFTHWEEILRGVADDHRLAGPPRPSRVRPPRQHGAADHDSEGDLEHQERR
jgi:CDP-diacylglycerol--glycerol-3-phosphate 3-phosphatidyltransferase